MQKLKQTLILSGNSNEMATLTLEKNNNGVFGTIKVFNLNDKSNLVIGISCNGNSVYKQNVAFNNGNLYTFKLQNLSDLDDIGCVLVRKVNATTFEPVLWGRKSNLKDKILAEFNDAYTSHLNLSSIKDVELKKVETSSNNKTFDETIKSDTTDVASLFEVDENEVEDIINKELNNDINLDDLSDEVEFTDDKNYILENDDLHKDFGVEINSNDDFFKEENAKLKSEGDSNKFFELISDQIDDLFDNYPRVDELEALIENSKWVKIDFENDGNEYVLGLIYEGFDLKYICYGVPGEFGSAPPKQLGECQWLPIDTKNLKDGYFVIYQDAVTGDKVNAI